MGEENVDNRELNTRRIEQFAEGGGVEFGATQTVSHFLFDGLRVFFFLEREGVGLKAGRAFAAYVYILPMDEVSGSPLSESIFEGILLGYLLRYLFLWSGEAGFAEALSFCRWSQLQDKDR